MRKALHTLPLLLVAACASSEDAADAALDALDAGRDYSFSHCAASTPPTFLLEVPCATSQSSYCFAEIPNPFF